MKDSTKRKIFRCCVIFSLTVAIILAAGWISDLKEQSEETVQMVSERTVIPGGQSVGIRMDVKGVLIVGLEEIETKKGVVSPGYDAGLQIGDMILSVNGIPVECAGDVERIVREKRNLLDLEVQRKKEILHISLNPVQCEQDGTYKLGIWVKERIAGIGTLSFYDPESGMYAALGHGIYESQTGTLLQAGKGKLLQTEVKSIREGEAGNPGEIRGIFCDDTRPLGNLKTNSQYGVYAEAENVFEVQKEPVVLASQEQVIEGPAVMLTTVYGSTVEQFDIRIDKVNRQKAAGSKGLEISVTDERLLEYCGGIVQGMSGSPIIQDNRLVGVVTHVFVNDPTRGYGIFAEFMVNEAESARNLKNSN
ncbi:MAG: SpoIVB peptidase [Firmicutes bacterium]|nr:SpoIVB peptidase [Bacillota bacterium]MDD7601993.1 SpoIVB peptidase [Bacillota bacterium]MDY5856009.1 SpoIVB peptidase [Anaerovoracaceae bacterium]